MEKPVSIWIYNIPNVHYLIAKRRPFSYPIASMDNTGEISYKMINGVSIPMPQWEQVVRNEQGQVWATFQGHIYDVTDLY